MTDGSGVAVVLETFMLGAFKAIVAVLSAAL
jgi:hypothetical protein